MNKYAKKFWQIWMNHPQSKKHEEVDIERFVRDDDFHDFVTKKAKQWVDIYEYGDDFSKSTEFYARVCADVFNFDNKRKPKGKNSGKAQKSEFLDDIEKLEYIEL